jgi:signal transduction histidine kinase
MEILIPEILDEARGLPMTITVPTLVVGLLLWLMGSWGHRFWLVLAITVAGGIAGLRYAPSLGLLPLVAVSAGILALALVRIMVYALAGLAAVALARALNPGWNEPTVFFLGGGLLGVIFFRLWITIITSLAGAVLIAYSSLCIGDRVGWLDAMTMLSRHGPLLNGSCLGVGAVGVAGQLLFERGRTARQKKKKEKEKEEEEERMRRSYQPPPKKKTWWGGTSKSSQRRAG